MTINCMIVDDEPIAREILETYISRMKELHLVESCLNAVEAYEGLHRHTVDLLFLDIRMPVITGTDFLRSLRNAPLVIFTTAYPHYAVEGFELNSVDYLLKPITFERFSQAVHKVTERLALHKPITALPPAPEPDYIFLKQDDKLVRVDFDQIRYIQAERDFCRVFLPDRKLLASMHLKMFEDLLPAQLFLRVHRSYIVNLRKVRVIKGNVIETDREEIPIGAHYRDALFQRLQL